MAEVIVQTVLPTDAPLHGDPEHLIREEAGIREPGPYFGALQAVADGYARTIAIASRLQIQQQLADRFLGRLSDLGYVTRVTPIEPDRKAVRRSHWKIQDPYFRFWFRYVLPNRSRLARGRRTEVAREIDADRSTYVGPIFEDCCREWVGRYSELGANAIEVGSWWSRTNDVEVDVAALTKSGYALLGNCKWWQRPVGENVLDALCVARAALGPRAAQARLAIFARSGFTAALSRRAEREGVTLVTVDGLFV